MRSIESREVRASISGPPSAPVGPVKSKMSFILMLQNRAAPIYAETKIEEQQLVAALKKALLSGIFEINEVIGGNHVPFRCDVFGPKLLAGKTQQTEQDLPASQRHVVRKNPGDVATLQAGACQGLAHDMLRGRKIGRNDFVLPCDTIPVVPLGDLTVSQD